MDTNSPFPSCRSVLFFVGMTGTISAKKKRISPKQNEKLV